MSCCLQILLLVHSRSEYETLALNLHNNKSYTVEPNHVDHLTSTSMYSCMH